MTGVDGRRSPALLPGLSLPSPVLTLALAVISLMASLDLGGASILARATSLWSGRLEGSATIVAGGRDLESADAAAARAAESLGRTVGIAEVRILEPAPMDALAGRLLGLEGYSPSTASPRMLSVRFQPGSSMTAGRAMARLRRDGLSVVVDDHGPWSGPIERLGLLAVGAVAGVLVVLLAIQVAFVGGAIRAMAFRRRDRLALLFQLGAGASTLTRPFRDHAVASAAAAAVLGSGAVVATIAILAFEPGIAIRLSVWLPWLPALDGLDVVASALWIPMAVATAAGAGQLAARGALRPLA
jgi:cell division protein FtsX